MNPATVSSPRPRKSIGPWIVYLSALVFYAWPYGYFGAILIQEANTNPRVRNQVGYLDAVYRSTSADGETARPSILGNATRAFPHYTDGIVDPLFPWLLRGSVDEAPEVVFARGKWLNFILSAVILLLFALAAARAFSFPGAAAVILMGGFGVILERSGFFTSDALYFLLVVMTWLCALSLIRQNALWMYGVFGTLIGLSYLAEPYIWPIMVGFVVVSLIRSVWVSFSLRRDKGDSGLWMPSNQIVGFAVMIAAFLLVTGPRLTYAGKTFGDPFHSYHRYSVWLESPEEAAQFRQTHPAKVQLEAIPPEEVPGPARFLREKGAMALVTRGWEGALAQVKSSVLGRGGWILGYGFLVFVVIAAIHRWAVWHQEDEVWQVRGTSARWMLLFLVVVLAITLFYAGVGNAAFPENPMTASLFLPVLLTFVWISERYRRQLQRTRYVTLVNRVYAALMGGAVLWITIRILVSIRTPVA